MNWKKILEIGLPIAGGIIGGPIGAAAPAVLNKRNRRFGSKDDPEEGHDYVANGLKELLEASFPDETIDRVNRIIMNYAALLVKEAKQAEQEEKEREAKARKRKPRTRNKPRKSTKRRKR